MMFSGALIWLIITIISHGFDPLFAGLKIQEYHIKRNVIVGGDPEWYRSEDASSVISCGHLCLDDPCCVSAIVTEAKYDGHVNCSLFDTYFADEYLKSKVGSHYIYKEPVAGEFIA